MTERAFSDLLLEAQSALADWEASFGSYVSHPTLLLDEHIVSQTLASFTKALRGNYPFFHPRYAGQMLKPPHRAAMLGYAAAMRINPNNHALDGGPPTAAMEKDVVQMLASMFGFPSQTLGHLTGGGTIANLEALFVAREEHPQKGVAVSSDAHYTHGRMGHLLGLPVQKIPTTPAGRMDVDALAEALEKGTIGTVIVTLGSTSLGAVDPLAEIVPLCRAQGGRIRVDAAYGGFFRVLADASADLLSDDVRRHYRATSEIDSIAIDPHKHGLQPYGCGAILFRDPVVGRHYSHDSPYTYFTSDELHLGEISLECSRPGAAAAALWFTLQLMPLAEDQGLGPILAACLRAAKRWYALLNADPVFTPLVTPELDIVTFFPNKDGVMSVIDRQSQEMFERLMDDEDPVFLSVLRASAQQVRHAFPSVHADQPQARILRSVLMKPEHEATVPWLHERVQATLAEMNAAA